MDVYIVQIYFMRQAGIAEEEYWKVIIVWTIHDKKGHIGSMNAKYLISWIKHKNTLCTSCKASVLRAFKGFTSYCFMDSERVSFLRVWYYSELMLNDFFKHTFALPFVSFVILCTWNRHLEDIKMIFDNLFWWFSHS